MPCVENSCARCGPCRLRQGLGPCAAQGPQPPSSQCEEGPSFLGARAAAWPVLQQGPHQAHSAVGGSAAKAAWRNMQTRHERGRALLQAQWRCLPGVSGPAAARCNAKPRSG
jgi:hypothetical protein